MSIRNALASVAVKDVKAAKLWYDKLLGSNGSSPMPEVAEWTFDRGGSLQVYEAPDRAGAGSFTLIVDDMDAQAKHLESLDIDTSDQASGKRVKTIMITDPDGNHIAFSQPMDGGLAH